ncbi:MAG: hypothetical protein H6704_02955 [Myxococcales bacterium]|nr:hypothetical protein [Myxococcales bacterium]
MWVSEVTPSHAGGAAAGAAGGSAGSSTGAAGGSAGSSAGAAGGSAGSSTTRPADRRIDGRGSRTAARRRAGGWRIGGLVDGRGRRISGIIGRRGGRIGRVIIGAAAHRRRVGRLIDRRVGREVGRRVGRRVGRCVGRWAGRVQGAQRVVLDALGGRLGRGDADLRVGGGAARAGLELARTTGGEGGGERQHEPGDRRADRVCVLVVHRHPSRLAG